MSARPGRRIGGRVKNAVANSGAHWDGPLYGLRRFAGNHGLLAPPGVVGWEPPVELGPGVAPALLLLPPMCFELLAEFEDCVSSVSAVTESGLMTIMTGAPSEFFARTMNDDGMMEMLVNPALLRSERSFWATCIFAPPVMAEFVFVSVCPFCIELPELAAAELAFAFVWPCCIGVGESVAAPLVGPLPASLVAVAPVVGPLPASPCAAHAGDARPPASMNAHAYFVMGVMGCLLKDSRPATSQLSV